MHAATLKGGLFGDNLASEIYQDMFFEEAASLMSKQKPGLGLADIVYQDILKLGSGTVTAPSKDVTAILDILGSVPSIASSKTSR
jgi:Rod binding domain-containing protein